MRYRKTHLKPDDLIDKKILQKMQDSFSAATGISAIMFDAYWNRITKQSPPYVIFCTEVIGLSKSGKKPCNVCDVEAVKRALAQIDNGSCPKIYRCHVGLWDYVAPILLGGQIIGYLCCGRVLSDEDRRANLNKYAQMAAESGIDEETYIDAMLNVPFLPKAKIEAALWK